DGRPCIFLDNPAGTQVPRRVVDAMATYLLTSNANTGGAFLTSRRSDATIGAARRAMADFVGASDPDCIIFGANMTTLTFAIARDHDANIAPWLALEEERGVRVQLADMHPDDGTLDLADLQRKLSSRTRLVAVTYASNALGTINDVARITALTHDAGALVWIDAVH